MKKTLPIIAASILICAGISSISAAPSVLGFAYPFGTAQHSTTGIIASMGGAGVAVNQPYNGLMLNPANCAIVDKTIFSALVSCDMISYVEGAAQSSQLSIAPTQFSFAFPLGFLGGLGFAFAKETDATVAFQGAPSIDSSIFGGTISEQRGIAQHGGITSWRAAWGRSFGKHLQLGLEFDRIYWQRQSSKLLNTIIQQTVPEVLTTYVQSNDSSYLNGAFNGLSLGIVVPIKAVRIGLAASYYFENEAQVYRGLYYSSGSFLLPNSSINTTMRVQLPPKGTLGFSWDITPEWLTALDLSTVLWNQFLADPDFISLPPNNTVTVSAGAQYHPVALTVAPRFWEKMYYRAGLRAGQLPAEGNYEGAASLGLSLPVGKNIGLLDFTVEYANRFSNSYPDFKEQIISISIGVNAGKKWVQSSQFNY